MKAGKFILNEEELIFSFAKSRGPGGQHVNKTNSKAVLHWNINETDVWHVDEEAKERFTTKYKNKISNDGFLVMSSDETRNQRKNIDLVKENLKEMLESISETPKKRKPIKISLTARQQRREEKIIKHRKKQQRIKNKCKKED